MEVMLGSLPEIQSMIIKLLLGANVKQMTIGKLIADNANYGYGYNHNDLVTKKKL